MTATQILVILECGHVNPAMSNCGSNAPCIECRKLGTIIDIHVCEWHAWCDTPSCSFSRWCALSRESARFVADAHARKYPQHEVKAGYRVKPEAEKVLNRRRKQGLVGY